MKKLYLKYKEIIDYIIAGVLTTIVAFVSYKATTMLLINFNGMHTSDGQASDMLIIVAQVVQWVLSVAFAFVVNKLFVFKNKENSFKSVAKQLATFAGSRVVTWFLETGIVLGGNKLFTELGWFPTKEVYSENFIIRLIEKLFTADFVAKCIAAFVVVICNYFISKLLVFRKKKSSAEDNNKQEN